MAGEPGSDNCNSVEAVRRCSAGDDTRPRRSEVSGGSLEAALLWAGLLMANCKFHRFRRHRNVSGGWSKTRGRSEDIPLAGEVVGDVRRTRWVVEDIRRM